MSSWRNTGLVVAAVLVGTAGLTVVAATPAAAAGPVQCDFDGDGKSDLAVGVPGENDRGAVNVQYQRTGYLSDPAILQEERLAEGSAFGAALACGDFDDNGVDDLAIGAPRAYRGKGKVFIYYGRPVIGLGNDAIDLFSQGESVPGTSEEWDMLGWSLDAGDVSGDAIDDLVVGVPGDRNPRWLDPEQQVGSVLVLHGREDGIRFDDSIEQLFGWLQYDGEEFEYGSSFGWSVQVGQFARGGSAELAVGAPNVSDRSHPDDAITFRAGRVYTFQDTQGLVPHRILEQDQADKTPGAEPYDRFGWSLAAGDFDANGHDDLAVGAPFEKVGKLDEAGEVDVFGGAPGGLPDGGTDQLVQLQAGGVIEAGDWFGFSLAAGDYDGDGWADLAVGAPHEWVGAAVAAGAVSVVRGDDGMVAETGTILTQGAGTIPDTSESGDRFGTSVATIGLLGDQDLIIGVPGEGGPSTLPDTFSGAVVLTVAGSQTHGPVGDPTLLLHQDSPAPYDVADQREPAAATTPYDMTHGEVLNGPQPAEPTGEWFGWSIAS